MDSSERVLGLADGMFWLGVGGIARKRIVRKGLERLLVVGVLCNLKTAVER
jgi:hypothetical protein